MKSVFQKDKECIVCGTTINLHEHHCIYGTANRKMSEKRGFKVYLCQTHHTGTNGVHSHNEVDTRLKEMCQRYYEEHYGTREEFMEEFGQNYLD